MQRKRVDLARRARRSNVCSPTAWPWVLRSRREAIIIA
jgi:hypothetical protein